MNLDQKFIDHIRQFPFIQKNERQLVAVSGGADSVVLCHLLKNAGYDFEMAHCNFQLRGEESVRDENFVKGLAVSLDKKLLIEHFETETYATLHKQSIQVAARELRYHWFNEMLSNSNHQVAGKLPETDGEPNTKNLAYILTAHHADDNVETVVMNFFRGTGLNGLTGMDVSFRKIFRPLLPFRKREILAYAKENYLPFVEDSSNANSDYTRNYFRNDLLPAIKKVFPQVEENLLNNINRLGEAAQIYNDAIQLHKKNLVEIRGNEEHIAIFKLQKQAAYKTILWEILQPKKFSAAQTDEAVKLMSADNGSYIQSLTHRIIRNRRWLIIAPLQSQESNHCVVIDEGVNTTAFAAGKLHLQNNIQPDNFIISPDKNVAAVDGNLVTYPMLLRRLKQGDYFYPLGMQKKKKVSRFLIDQKLSLIEKENIWVVESNKKIVWIVNHRIDDRFKIKPATKTIIKITFKL